MRDPLGHSQCHTTSLELHRIIASLFRCSHIESKYVGVTCSESLIQTLRCRLGPACRLTLATLISKDHNGLIAEWRRPTRACFLQQLDVAWVRGVCPCRNGCAIT